MKITFTAILCLLVAFSLSAQIYINEVDYDQPGTDDAEFIELVGPDGASLDGYAIVLVNGFNGTVYDSLDLTGRVIPNDNINGYGFFVVGAATVPNVDSIPPSWTIQNGSPDGILLKLNGVVVDGFSYEGEITNNPDFTTGMAINADENNNVPNLSIGRIILGFDDTNQNQYFAQNAEAPSPGEINTAHGQVLGGDPPPVIFNITRTPFIPNANENTTVSADITDDSDVVAAELRYIINGGAMQTVAMTNISGDTWSADIPESAYNDGDRVGFWIWAQDDAPQTSESDTVFFFSGTTPIADLHPVDADGVLLYRGYDARITGVSTVDNGTFSTTSLDVYMQDATGGINVFSFSIDTSFSFIAGNNYTVIGEVDQFNGKTEIIPRDASDIVDLGPGTPATPAVRTIAELLAAAETYEGMLVAILQVSPTGGGDPWPAQGISANIEISDDGGTNVLIMRIDQDTDIDGSPEPNWPVNIAGIFNQFDTSLPYTGDYQILPRSTDDIDITVGIKPVPGAQLPEQFSLHQNYPNPFNPETVLRFDVPAGTSLQSGEKVQLDIYNLLGQRVATLVDEPLPAGSYEITWNATTNNGRELAGGVYFGVLKANQMQKTIKMVLVK